MYLINGFVIVCLIFMTFYSIGLLNFLSDFEEDKCEMTYMFEYPQFVRVSHKTDERFPKYGLYAYSEGRFTSKVRSMRFNGIPVLFIPGNGGSFKQVRSLSSIALRKALNSGTPFNFDYFTVDLNNELSGLYGPLLYDQMEYVNSSINRILGLYEEQNNKPSSVILIGHSMGGVIAKKLILETESDMVSLLITLAAPLKRPPLIFDYDINSFYKDMKNIENNKTVIISVSGGYSDFLVPSYLSDVIGCNNSLNVVSTNIPRSWLESNHVQIIWCKQTVLAISRALFDSVDIKTKQISKNRSYVLDVFKHHLVQHNGIKFHKLRDYNEPIAINYKGEWIEHLSKKYSVEFLRGLRETHWYMLKLTNLPDHQMLSVLAVNVETVNWVFACNANMPKGTSRVCTEVIHLTQLSEISPSVKYKRRYFQIDMHQFKKNHSDLTHIVVRALPTKEPIVFHMDIYKIEERQIEVNLPSWYTTFKKTVILEQTIEKAVHYELILKQLQHVSQFYQLFVELIHCKDEDHHASASLVAPWGNQDHHAYFTSVEKKPLDLRLYLSKPLSEVNKTASVKLTLHPSCSYRVSIKPSVFGMFGQMARISAPFILTNIAVIVLLSLRYQLKLLKSGTFPIIFVALKEGVKPFHLLPFVKILSLLVGTFASSVKPDADYLVADGTDFFALPILLFLSSIGIVFLFGIIFNISLVTLDSTMNKLSLKLTRIFFSIGWSEYFVTSVLEKAPFIAALVLMLTTFSTCGGVALCLGGIFYFLKLTHMSQDYIEKIVWFAFRKFIKICRSFISRKTKASETHDAVERVTDVKLDASDQSVEKELADEDIENNVDKTDNNTKELSKETDSNKKNDDGKNELEIQDDEASKNDDVEEQDKEIAEVEEVTENKEKDDSKTTKNPLNDNELTEACNSIFFHSSIFFIWCIVSIINLPATLTWAHNFKYQKALSPDTSFIPGIVLSACALPLWQFDFPNVNKKWITVLEIFVATVAVVSATYATVSIYILNYLLTLVVLVITLHQLFAPENNVENDEQDKNVENKSKYDNSKLKMN